MRLIAFLISVLFLTACASRPMPGPDLDALFDANARYERARVERDAAALDAIYTDDFTSMSSYFEVWDKTKMIRTLTGNLTPLINLSSDDITVEPLGDTHALMTGHLTSAYGGVEGQIYKQWYTSIWVLEDGRWRLRHEHHTIIPPLN